MDCGTRMLIQETHLGFGGSVATRSEDSRQVVRCLSLHWIRTAILVWSVILLNDLPQHVVVASEALYKDTSIDRSE